MMYLKTMSGRRDLGEDDTRKDFTIDCVAPGGNISFVSGIEWVTEQGAECGAVIADTDGSMRTIPLRGNAYVMSNTGKTIAHHSPYGEPDAPKILDVQEWMKKAGFDFVIGDHPNGAAIAHNRTMIHVTLDEDDPRPDLTAGAIMAALKGIVPLHRIYMQEPPK